MAGNPRWLLLLTVAICYCSLFNESQAAATWKSGPAGQKAKIKLTKSGLTSGKLFGKLLSKATSHGFASMREKISLLGAKPAATSGPVHVAAKSVTQGQGIAKKEAKDTADCCANLFLDASGPLANSVDNAVLQSYYFYDFDSNGNPVYFDETSSFFLMKVEELWVITDSDVERVIVGQAYTTECAEDNFGGWGFYDPDTDSYVLDTTAIFTCF